MSLELREPIVLAPLAGGPSTAALAAAVSAAGGLGFLAAGYKAPDAVERDINSLRETTNAPFGVNLFVPGEASPDRAAVAAYVERLASEAERHDVALGEPRADDDAFADKLALVARERVPVVSFTFGCPQPDAIAEVKAAGAQAWVTVTTVEEARTARTAGADALVVQGMEAGGHRASYDDEAEGGDLGVLALLRLVSAAVDLPLVAAGGIADGAGVAAVLAGGAALAQLGSAFLLCPEAGTSAAHREALARGGRTAVTRAFSGRRARGLVNRFMAEHDAEAPSAYPEIHHVTAPLRAAARERGDAETINLWAGQAHPLARELPAGELVRRLGADARVALAAAQRRWA
ncbi:MAG TPA: nitronate monooxygenase [Solirubrobacteraceae bacterium]